MSAAEVLTAGLTIARIGLDLLTGARRDTVKAASEIAGHAIMLVPIDDLRAHLAEVDRKAIDAAADIAEEIKLAEENKP